MKQSLRTPASCRRAESSGSSPQNQWRRPELQLWQISKSGRVPCFQPKSSSPQFLFEIRNGLLDAFLQRDPGFPAQYLAGARNIGLALLRVTYAARILDKQDTGLIPDNLIDGLCELQDRHLMLVANVHRQMLVGQKQFDNAIDQVIHITEGTRLAAIAIDGERLAQKRLFQ